MNKRHIKFNAPYLSKFSKKNIFKVLKNNKFADGEFQKKCEVFIERKIKSKCVKLTQSCTSALETSMILCNIKKGDEVIIPSFTFTSTANCLLLRGAKPIFVDINISDLNIDLNDLEKKITKKTKAIMLIHVLSNSTNMDRLLKLKKKYNLIIIEDTCESLGSKYKNKYLGTFGDFSTFSFYYSHQITSGEGGMVCCKEKSDYEIMKSLRSHGWSRGLVNEKKISNTFKEIDSKFIFYNSGFNLRQNLYNLYHLLNHLNLFGEVYLNQTNAVLDQLLSEI